MQPRLISQSSTMSPICQILAVITGNDLTHVDWSFTRIPGSMINIATFSKGAVSKRTAPNTGGRVSCRNYHGVTTLPKVLRFIRASISDVGPCGIAAHEESVVIRSSRNDQVDNFRRGSLRSQPARSRGDCERKFEQRREILRREGSRASVPFSLGNAARSQLDNIWKLACK